MLSDGIGGVWLGTLYVLTPAQPPGTDYQLGRDEWRLEEKSGKRTLYLMGKPYSVIQSFEYGDFCYNQRKGTDFEQHGRSALNLWAIPSTDTKQIIETSGVLTAVYVSGIMYVYPLAPNS